MSFSAFCIFNELPYIGPMKSLLVLILMMSQQIFAQTQQELARANDVAKAFQFSGCMQVSTGACRSGYNVQTFAGQQLQQLPPQVQKALYDIAHVQAQIWGDTILEGDFFADGKVQVQKVKVLYKGQRRVGFSITYYEKAWYTGDCDFHYGKLESLRSCRPGHIVESAFVSTNATEAQVDENQFAKFLPQD